MTTVLCNEKQLVTAPAVERLQPCCLKRLEALVKLPREFIVCGSHDGGRRRL